MAELAETIRMVVFPVALGAWGYSIYCCNAIESRQAHKAAPMPLSRWLLGELPAGAAVYRRRFFVSTVVFVWALVISRVVSVVAGLD